MDPRMLDEIRKLGLMRKSADGHEAVLATAQCRSTLAGRSSDEDRKFLEGWVRNLARTLGRNGCIVNTGTLSPLARTVEVVVPVEMLDAVESELASHDIRLDLVRPVQMTS